MLYNVQIQSSSLGLCTQCNRYIKVKVKLNLEQATKVQRGSRGNSNLSLTPVLVVVGGQRHAPAAVPPGKTRYRLYRRLGGPASQPVWSCREILAPTGIRFPDCSSRSESLYQLSYPGSANIYMNTKTMLEGKKHLICWNSRTSSVRRNLPNIVSASVVPTDLELA
jgi:hypothetical protein